jgi:hypothetical protein
MFIVVFYFSSVSASSALDNGDQAVVEKSNVMGCASSSSDAETSGLDEILDFGSGLELEIRQREFLSINTEAYHEFLDGSAPYLSKLGKYYSQGNTNACFTTSLINANIATHPYIDGNVVRGKGRLFRYMVDCIQSKIGSSWLDGVELGSRQMYSILECKKDAVQWLLRRDSEISLHVLLYGGQSPYGVPQPSAHLTNYHKSLKTLCWEMKEALEQNDASDSESGAVQLFVSSTVRNPDGSVARTPDGTPIFSGGHAVAVSSIECEPVIRITIIDSERPRSPRHETLGDDGTLEPSDLMIGGAVIESNSLPLGSVPL